MSLDCTCEANTTLQINYNFLKCKHKKIKGKDLFCTMRKPQTTIIQIFSVKPGCKTT